MSRFFRTPSEFRNWLEKNHVTALELRVGFYKKGSGRQSMTWSESVDEALRFGWIDGIRKSVDENSYQIRFHAAKNFFHANRCGEEAVAGKYSAGNHLALGTETAKRKNRRVFERSVRVNLTLDVLTGLPDGIDQDKVRLKPAGGVERQLIDVLFAD